jgi:hypothetical protein
MITKLIILAYLAMEKTKCYGKTTSQGRICKYHDALLVLFGAEKANKERPPTEDYIEIDKF